MELRDIEIFLTLTQELHFGRAAERLRVSQARVSQAIRAQERRIGAPLFERTTRSVRLTPLGQQLRDDLEPVYANLQQSMERARMAARGINAQLRVGLMPFNIAQLHHYWRTFRARHPQWELNIRLAHYSDPFGQLRSGAFDVFVAWLPVQEPDLTVGPELLADPRVLAVSAEHPLAARASAPLEVLGDFPTRSADFKLDYWEDSYLPFHTRRGRQIQRNERALHADEVITAVGMGEIVVPFPSHVTEYWGIHGIRYLPMADLPALRYALIWRTETENALIRALAAVVRDIGPLLR